MQLQFTDRDAEITSIFRDLGLKSNEARVLVVFFKGYELTSKEIERIVDLKQPEVSIALTLFIKMRLGSGNTTNYRE